MSGSVRSRSTPPIGLDDLAGSVVRVGDGRGFVVAGGDTRYVITAAHCLPFLPPAILARGAEEATYLDLIGRGKKAAHHSRMRICRHGR